MTELFSAVAGYTRIVKTIRHTDQTKCTKHTLPRLRLLYLLVSVKSNYRPIRMHLEKLFAKIYDKLRFIAS